MANDHKAVITGVQYCTLIWNKATELDGGAWARKAIRDVIVAIILLTMIGVAVGWDKVYEYRGIATIFGLTSILIAGVVEFVFKLIEAPFALHNDQLRAINAISSNLAMARYDAAQVHNSRPDPVFVRQVIEHLINEAQSALHRQDSADLKSWNEHATIFVATALSAKHKRDFEACDKLNQNHPNPENRKVGDRLHLLRQVLTNFREEDVRHDCTEDDLAGWHAVV